MNEADVNNYLLRPNTTSLTGFTFRINYSDLSDTVPDELLADEITKISTKYKPIFFNLLFKISKLLLDPSELKNHLLINHEAVKTVFLEEGWSWDKVFTFNLSGQLIILSGNNILEIERLSENTFEIKVLSLDQTQITSLKTEITNLQSGNSTIFTSPEDIVYINNKINELYVQALNNILIKDFNSFRRTYRLFCGINPQLKELFFGLNKKINHALYLNEEPLQIGAIAIISLLIENRLAHIYAMENGTYNDDKTLGQLITELNNQHHLNDIHMVLNNFKDIRNNLVHYHGRTFNIYNSFVESVKYLGQFMIWCKDNGRL